jgi:ComF family protein
MIYLQMPRAKQVYDGLLYLFFPSLCPACDRALPDRAQQYCVPCSAQLNPSPMYLHEENIFTQRMYGKVALHSGAALYHFAKGGPVQKIVHRLKYRNRPDLGTISGEKLGRLLLNSPHFQGIDLVIPVPLHPKKEKERGYNQSAAFGEGIATEMLLPMLSDVLIRQTNRASQTKLGRLDRYANVHEVYTVKRPNKIEGKHILLVDDVLTTGATLATCGDLLLRAGAAKVSAVTLAIAL